MLKRTTKILATSLALASFMSPIQAGEVEVLHWWTSGGEAESVGELKKMLEAEGHSWKDFAVAGGGGENAMTALKSRAVSGNPPTAAQIKGPAIQEWGDEGVLANLDGVAKANNWDGLLPAVVSDVMKYDGSYVAVPVNVHRVNWLWANPEVFEKAGAKIPSNWDEFFMAAEKIKQAGMLPVAHGGEAWQDATVFEAIVLAEGGADFFNDAFVKLRAGALRSKTMQNSFDTFRKYQSYTDEGNSGRDWNLATAMVIEGKAGMQIMGDWAKGEFTAAGKKPGVDFVCTAAPGTSDEYTFNIDSFVMFEQSDSSKTEAQNAMAKIILDPEFQEVFNLNKGSIPARTSGVPKGQFDACALMSMDDFVATDKSGGLVPSMAQGMSTFSSVQGAIYDVVTNFFNTPTQSSADAVKKLADAVAEAK